MSVRSLSYLAAQTFIDKKYPQLARVYELEGEPAVEAVIKIAKIIQDGIFFDSQKSKSLDDHLKLPENITLKQITREKKIFIKKAIVAITKDEPFFISSSLLGIFGYIYASRGEDNIHVIFKTGPPMSGFSKDVVPSQNVLSGRKTAMVCPRVKRLGSHINVHELSLLQEITLTPQGRAILPEIYLINTNGLTALGENLIMVLELGDEDLHCYLHKMNGFDRMSQVGQDPVLLNFELKTRLSIAIQILKILDVTEQLNVVHRDVKSNNFMVMKRGRTTENLFPVIKIIDFGLGRNLNEIAKDGILKPTYGMAPEMAVLALKNQSLKERFSGLKARIEDLIESNRQISAELNFGEFTTLAEIEIMQNKSRVNSSEIKRCKKQMENIFNQKEILDAQWREQMYFSYDVWHVAQVLRKVFKPWLSAEFFDFYHRFFREGIHSTVGDHRASAQKMARLNTNAELQQEFFNFVPNEGIEEIIKAMLEIDVSKRLSASQAMREFQFLRNSWFPESPAGAVGFEEEEEDFGGAGAARA